MKRSLATLILVLVAVSSGCDSETSVPTATPTATPTTPLTPAESATCYPWQLRYQEITVPPISDIDHAHGSVDADIVIIEYADFQ